MVGEVVGGDGVPGRESHGRQLVLFMNGINGIEFPCRKGGSTRNVRGFRTGAWTFLHTFGRICGVLRGSGGACPVRAALSRELHWSCC
jgi:hypothetical protein